MKGYGMGTLTDAQLLTDLLAIFSDLSATNAVESVTLQPVAKGATPSTFDAIRAKTLSEKELRDVGWGRKYQLSIYVTRASGASALNGDVVNMTTEGELRILNISRGPARVYLRFDLGNKFGGRP